MNDEPTEEEKEIFTSLSKLMDKYNLDFIDVSRPGEMYIMKNDLGTPMGVCSI